MRKLSLFLVLLLVLSGISVVTAQDAQPLRVGLSWNVKDSVLIQAWEDYMLQVSAEEGPANGLAFEWIINVADADPARQAANIEDLLNQDVDLIIARAEDSAAIGASIRSAEEAGVPFVTFDRASSTTQPTAHVGGDSYQQGLSTAEAFAEILAANDVQGQCIETQGALTDVNAVNRSTAWNEVDAASDQFETIVQVPTEWNPDLFLSGISNALQAFPEANCMFLASDFAFSAVQAALEGAGRWAPQGEPNHMWLATQDMFPAAVEAMEAGYVTVGTTYDAYAHAVEAIRVIIAIAKGEDPACGENGCLAAGRVVTQENVLTLENFWARDYAEEAPAELRTVRVGLSWNVKDSALIQAWEDYLLQVSAEMEAESGLRFEWIINVADADPARQAANIEDLLNQGVDLIIARAEDSAAIGASIRAAEEAGVPFVTFDRASSTTAPTAHVGGDSYQQGVSTAEAFVEILAENDVVGECIETQGALTDVNAVNRSTAWNEVDAASEQFSTLVQVPTEWNPDLFLSGISNALQAFPQANCMFLASDFAFSAVQSALETAGRWVPQGEEGHMWIATQDMFPAAVEAMEAGYVTVGTTYDAYAHAVEAIRVLTAILNGEDPGCGENGCLAAGRVVTQENVATLENFWSRDYADWTP
jgi:ABC-type sugar transport system substrate-binding protein